MTNSFPSSDLPGKRGTICRNTQIFMTLLHFVLSYFSESQHKYSLAGQDELLNESRRKVCLNLRENLNGLKMNRKVHSSLPMDRSYTECLFFWWNDCRCHTSSAIVLLHFLGKTSDWKNAVLYPMSFLCLVWEADCTWAFLNLGIARSTVWNRESMFRAYQITNNESTILFPRIIHSAVFGTEDLQPEEAEIILGKYWLCVLSVCFQLLYREKPMCHILDQFAPHSPR